MRGCVILCLFLSLQQINSDSNLDSNFPNNVNENYQRKVTQVAPSDIAHKRLTVDDSDNGDNPKFSPDYSKFKNLLPKLYNLEGERRKESQRNNSTHKKLLVPLRTERKYNSDMKNESMISSVFLQSSAAQDNKDIQAAGSNLDETVRKARGIFGVNNGGYGQQSHGNLNRYKNDGQHGGYQDFNKYGDEKKGVQSYGAQKQGTNKYADEHGHKAGHAKGFSKGFEKQYNHEYSHDFGQNHKHAQGYDYNDFDGHNYGKHGHDRHGYGQQGVGHQGYGHGIYGQNQGHLLHGHAVHPLIGGGLGLGLGLGGVGYGGHGIGLGGYGLNRLNPLFLNNGGLGFRGPGLNYGIGGGVRGIGGHGGVSKGGIGFNIGRYPLYTNGYSLGYGYWK